MWPWRSRPPAGSVSRAAPDLPGPLRRGYAALGTIQRTVGPPMLTIGTHHARDLAAWRAPTYLAPDLCHVIDPDGPSGLLATSAVSEPREARPFAALEFARRRAAIAAQTGPDEQPLATSGDDDGPVVPALDELTLDGLDEPIALSRQVDDAVSPAARPRPMTALTSAPEPLQAPLVLRPVEEEQPVSAALPPLPILSLAQPVASRSTAASNAGQAGSPAASGSLSGASDEVVARARPSADATSLIQRASPATGGPRAATRRASVNDSASSVVGRQPALEVSGLARRLGLGPPIIGPPQGRPDSVDAKVPLAEAEPMVPSRDESERPLPRSQSVPVARELQTTTSSDTSSEGQIPASQLPPALAARNEPGRASAIEGDGERPAIVSNDAPDNDAVDAIASPSPADLPRARGVTTRSTLGLAGPLVDAPIPRSSDAAEPRPTLDVVGPVSAPDAIERPDGELALVPDERAAGDPGPTVEPVPGPPMTEDRSGQIPGQSLSTADTLNAPPTTLPSLGASLPAGAISEPVSRTDVVLPPSDTVSVQADRPIVSQNLSARPSAPDRDRIAFKSTPSALALAPVVGSRASLAGLTLGGLVSPASAPVPISRQGAGIASPGRTAPSFAAQAAAPSAARIALPSMAGARQVDVTGTSGVPQILPHLGGPIADPSPSDVRSRTEVVRDLRLDRLGPSAVQRSERGRGDVVHEPPGLAHDPVPTEVISSFSGPEIQRSADSVPDTTTTVGYEHDGQSSSDGAAPSTPSPSRPLPTNPDAEARRLYAGVRKLLGAELRVDRERAGFLTD